MGNIILLDEHTSNKIAAGEVIENPASVVKELVENSLDADADSIQVEIRNGGKTFIKVIDNGTGIKDDDVEIAFERHATSKIRKSDDLDTILSLGFRGEALASIASVSKVELVTKTKSAEYGKKIKISAGIVQDVMSTGCQAGTTFIVRDLFFNTPARFKFLKKDRTEAGYVSDIISRLALGNPHISFKLTIDGKTVLYTPGNNDPLSAIFSIYGKETANSVLKLSYESEIVKVSGFIGKSKIARANRSHQSVYINRRYIKSKVITAAIDEACKSFLMKNKFAFAVLYLDINPSLVDVNVHPSKLEVRFSNESEIFKSVYNAINNALYSQNEALEINQNMISIVNTTNEEKFITREPTKSSLDMKPKISAYKVNPYNKAVSFLNDKENEKKIVSQTTFVKNIEAEPVNYQNKTTDNPAIKKEEKASDYRETDIRSDFLSNAKIIGQLFSTYILLDNGTELILIDQHAAHERIMYEQLKEKYRKKEPLSQMLFNSEVIEVTHNELRFLEDQREIFKELGFTYESFGNNSIILRSVPFIMDNNRVKQNFLDVLDYLLNSLETGNNVITDDALYNIACKIAVKANKRLNEREIEGVLKELLAMKNPFNCPHGRPTVIRLSRHEIEKMFKRRL